MADVYNSQLDAFDLYHLYNERQKKPSILDGPALPAIGHAAAGAAGSAISSVVVYPLDLIVTRLQIQRQNRKEAGGGASEEYKSIIDAAQKIYYREGGLQALYAGVGEDTAKSIADAFLFFLAYNFLRGVRQKRLQAGASHLSAIEELSVGFAAGAFGKLLTTPIANIVTRLQTSSMTAQGQNKQTAADVASQIRREKGLPGFWSGYPATLVLTLNPSLTFFFFESLKRFTLPRRLREHPTPAATFLLAAVSKALASTITYPFSLAKARAQASAQSLSEPVQDEKPSGGRTLGSTRSGMNAGSRAARNTVFAIILHIARTEGVGALYEGLEGEVLKGFFSHGTTMLVKEGVHTLVIRLYYIVLKLLRRYPSPQEMAARTKTQATTTLNEARHQAEHLLETARDQATETMATARQGIDSGVGSIQRFGDESAHIANDQANEAYKTTQTAAQKTSESFKGVADSVADQVDKVVNDVKKKIGQ